MEFVILIVTILWLIRIVRNVFSYVHLWWVKEYRFDRMLIHLKTPKGKVILFLPFRKPPISPKTIVLSLVTCITLITFFYLLPISILFKLLFLDVLLFPITWVWVEILKLPTYLYHEFLIYQAVKKLKSHHFKHVIGITGSYGKTSTKEFLVTILESKFKVLKTETSKNSPIAIAELVLKYLKPEHELFVVEMAAYKNGEIRRMSEMVRPDIGIVTAINAQHQDLFGTLENKMKAKYELIEGLAGNRVAIFNADNSHTRQMSEWTKDKKYRVQLYTKETKNLSEDKTIYGNNIQFYSDHITFDVRYMNKAEKISVEVLGEHQVSNILAALLAAIDCGMTLQEATSAAQKIKPFTKTMEPTPGIKGATFINDTFNNNPDAAKAAIAYLSHMKGRKVLVFQPMIELGEFAESAHVEVGKCAASVCDDFILTNHNFFPAIEKGVKSSKSSVKLQVLSPQGAAAYIESQIKKGDTVLFKGKETENTLKILTKH